MSAILGIFSHGLIRIERSYDCLNAAYRTKRRILMLNSRLRTCADFVSFEICLTVNKIRKIVGIYFDCIFASKSLENYKILVHTLNRSKKEVIWNELGYKTALRFEQQIFNKYFPEVARRIGRELSQEEKNSLFFNKINRVRENGICYGASLVTLASILFLNPQSENELIQVMRSFKKGFSKEAEAVQYVNEGLQESSSITDSKMAGFLEEYKNLNWSRKQNLKDLIEMRKNLNLQQSSHCQTKEDVEKKLSEIERLSSEVNILEAQRNKLNEAINLNAYNRLCHEIESFSESVRYRDDFVASLTGLSLASYDSLAFTGIGSQKSVTKKFNHLLEGGYKITFPLEGCAHAIVYMKFTFGSYLMDPNIGLIKCPQEDPSRALNDLFEKLYAKQAAKGVGDYQSFCLHKYVLAGKAGT